MHRSPTSLASWVGVIHRTLVSCGCDADGILLAAGIAPPSLQTPQARIPIEQTSRLWQLATAAAHDAGFGIRVASHVRANRLGRATPAATGRENPRASAPGRAA